MQFIVKQTEWKFLCTCLWYTFTNPSSKLVKENVVDMSEEEAKKILQLKPVDFDYIEAYGGEKISMV